MGTFYTDVLSKSPHFHSTERVSDPSLLEPETRRRVLALVADAAAHGVDLMIFETYRSQERQQMLYTQGASQLRTVGVHHYGLACDIVRRVNGEPSWKGDFSLLGQLARAHGLIWGGDWGAPGHPHSFVDTCHVQRCPVARQAGLFRGDWYPDANYDPWHELAPHSTSETNAILAQAKAATAGRG